MAKGIETETDNGKQNSKSSYTYSGKIGFKLKMLIRDKEGSDKWATHPEDETTVDRYAAYTRAPEYMKQTLVEPDGEANSRSMTAGDFHSPLSTMVGDPDKESVRK